VTRGGRPSKIEVIGTDVFVYLNGKRGGVAICSKEDLAKIEGKAWHQDQTGYPTWIPWDHPRRQMHQIVLGVFGRKSGKVVDHINHNRMDNRRENLRVVDRTTNAFHSNKYPGAGISFCAKYAKWRAYISYKRKRIHIGSYSDRADAMAARRAAELQYYGVYKGEK
jgi:hypothetical protein